MEAMFNSHALVNIARMLSQHSGIRLVIDPQAKTFSATPGVLKMPPLAVIAERFPQAVDMEIYTVGAVYHETGHMLHTDYELRKAFRELYEGHEHFEVANGLGQAIEDVVIERAQCERFPGARPALTAMWRLLYRKYGVHEAQSLTPLKKAHAMLFHACRHSVLRQTWTEHFAQEYRKALLGDFTTDQVNALENEILKLDFASSTSDGFEIGVRMLASLGIHPIQQADERSQEGQSRTTQASGPTVPEQSQQQEPSEKPEDVAQTTDQSGGAASEQGEPKAEETADSMQGEGSQPNTESPQAETPCQEERDATDQDDVQVATSIESDSNDEDEVTQLVAAAMAELTESLPDEPEMAVVFGSIAGNGLAKERTVTLDPTPGMQLREAIAQQAMYATERLSTLLKAQTEAQTEIGRKGKLMAARVWKLKAGSMRIFRNTVEGIEYSTAVKILLDRSGSMRSGMRTAISAAAFLPLTFENIEGLHCSLDIFPGVRSVVEPLKGFEDRSQACLDKMANVAATGGTPMVEAMQESSQDLLDFHADRKLLLVITDGEPYDKAGARKMVKGLQADGVEVIGIGIGGETRQAMKVIFDDYCVIRTVHELTDQLAQTMEVKLVAQQNAA